MRQHDNLCTQSHLPADVPCHTASCAAAVSAVTEREQMRLTLGLVVTQRHLHDDAPRVGGGGEAVASLREPAHHCGADAGAAAHAVIALAWCAGHKSMAARVLHADQVMLGGAQPSADARQTIQLPGCICWHAASRCSARHRLVSASNTELSSKPSCPGVRSRRTGDDGQRDALGRPVRDAAQALHVLLQLSERLLHQHAVQVHLWGTRQQL